MPFRPQVLVDPQLLGPLGVLLLASQSRGAEWGEDGFIRLERHAADDGDWQAGYCGFDTDGQAAKRCRRYDIVGVRELEATND